MSHNRIYFIGLRYPHHARHSGYEQFGHSLGTFLPAPVKFRWTKGKWGWPLNQAIVKMTRHPWYSLGANLTEWRALLHMLWHRRCLYHILYGDSDLWLLRHANKFTGNLIVASFHQPTFDLRKLGLIERVARNVDAVILVSEEQRAYFEEFLPPDRVFVVPHGVDTTFFRPAEQQDHDAPVCLTVGSHLRDFDTLGKAICLVWKANPNVRFLAIGTRSTKKCYFSGIEDRRIQYLDGVSDEVMLHSYQTSNVAVFCFSSATANNAILEAMSVGLPIVATNVGGIREYVDDRIGILCRPKDPQTIAEGILHLLNDTESRRSKMKESRERALSLDFKRIADKMCAIYSEILMRR